MEPYQDYYDMYSPINAESEQTYSDSAAQEKEYDTKHTE
jgi:hypothetical protein